MAREPLETSGHAKAHTAVQRVGAPHVNYVELLLDLALVEAKPEKSTRASDSVLEGLPLIRSASVTTNRSTAADKSAVERDLAVRKQAFRRYDMLLKRDGVKLNRFGIPQWVSD